MSCHQLRYLGLQCCYILNSPFYFIMPMPTSSPTCIVHEPLIYSPHRCPRAGLTQNCPILGIPRPRYLLGFDIHFSLRISVRNTSIEPCLARIAIHRLDLSCTDPLVPPTKIISLIFHPPFSPSASPATLSMLLMRMSCWTFARDSPRSQ